MLVSSGAPLNLWGEAILSACHIQNRIPYKKTSKTPYELCKGCAPNIAYLKVWGCLAKVLLPEPKKRKLGPKTFDAMFIGYAKNSVAYRFLVTKSENNLVDVNTIIETKNADFFENIFPMKLNMKIPKKVKSKNSVATASFFGLRSLRKLNLSDCHILEGAIPNDFSSLCSLEYLDLSKNNFVTLPTSLNQLSQLKGLRLGYCKRLQSLPELPSSIE